MMEFRALEGPTEWEESALVWFYKEGLNNEIQKWCIAQVPVKASSMELTPPMDVASGMTLIWWKNVSMQIDRNERQGAASSQTALPWASGAFRRNQYAL